MTDKETIAAYDERAQDYARFTEDAISDPLLLKFIDHIPQGGVVLDLGCGPAAASAAMRDAGLQVDPVDASCQMVQLANERFQIGARVATFDDIEGQNIYDGVWANYSLLHASPEKFPLHLNALHRAIVPGGLFHVALKLGKDTGRDDLNRLYSYYSEEELNLALKTAGFEPFETTTGNAPGLAGKVEPWIAILSRAVKAR